MIRRRDLGILGAAALGLAGCDADTGPTGPDPSAEPIAAAAADARALLAAAEAALGDAFGPVEWSDGDPERSSGEDGDCLYSTVTRRADAALGLDVGAPQDVVAALTDPLAEHGWSELPVPEGGTGGWLTAESTRGTLTFRIRIKGTTEIAVSGTVAADPCELPPVEG